MKLWILRHGKAQAMAASDPQRALTERGRADVLHMAELLRDQQLDGILASPYLRAQQTAGLVGEHLNFARGVATAPWLTPDDDPMQVINYLSERTEQSLLLVSHQPLVSQLVSLLVEGHRRGHYPMPTAALACLEMDVVAAGLAQLLSLNTPKDS
ncbi:phosphohistidine phosphatase SixA [Halopseudomonas phragmitis]|uniref:Phosphohistidine phosphatase SixA n=1 Tax=Halopseudomonas phragmitis TaxID=1931241 RepID=A0A1V0B851_9GAMM|nr:phosphohistidine phosphatase SixA [Halopseudomonas phragmitis]AQZ95954.1 phosphohistidine phosphatase SixA [Halopseudomonas phragmitis]